MERDILWRLLGSRDTWHGLEASGAHVAWAFCEVGEMLFAVPFVEIFVGAGGGGKGDGEEEVGWA